MNRPTRILCHFFWTCLGLLLATACTPTLSEKSPFGIETARTGYVPASIALVSCQIWPDRASRISGMPLSNIPRAEMQKLCTDLDQFIIAGFDNQPFMKGLTQKYVDKLYHAKFPKQGIAESIAHQWEHKSDDCVGCRTATSFYHTSIEARKPWSVWLTEFAKATNGSDSLLLPLIIYNNITHDDERGLVVARRTAGVALLLIDTNTGELIWSGGREAEVVSKVFRDDPRAGALDPPDQDELKKRLFTDALWLEFPGRQIYK